MKCICTPKPLRLPNEKDYSFGDFVARNNVTAYTIAIPRARHSAGRHQTQAKSARGARCIRGTTCGARRSRVAGAVNVTGEDVRETNTQENGTGRQACCGRSWGAGVSSGGLESAVMAC